MGKVPKPNIQWKGAHPNNYTVGRPGASRDGRGTEHHVVGSAESAVAVFNQASRGASSHLVITARTDVAAYQCVDFNNTAWCDGNWESNLRTISMEHHGDWRNGYKNEQVIKNAAHVVAWLRENYGVKRLIKHRDVSLKATQCPADLPVDRIWAESTKIIEKYNKPTPPPQPEWLKNRKAITPRKVYAQKAGRYLYNLNDTSKPADSRRFVLNQDFSIGSETTVGGKKYYITVSSTQSNTPNGLLSTEVADKPYVPPIVTPPKPTTPDWADSVVDTPNRTLYVLRATPLIDLEFGRPFMKDGKEVWYQAGDIIENVSAHTFLNGVTYQLTEYSFQEIKGKHYQNANGIKADDLTTDPKATPPGTPANPTPPPEPDDPVPPMPDVPSTPEENINWLVKAVKAILAFFKINV